MYSPGDWDCCSYVPVALLAAGGTEIKYFLWFLDLNPLSRKSVFQKTRTGSPSLPFPAGVIFFLGKSNPYSIKIRKSVLARKKFRGFRGFRKSKKQKSGEITDQVRVVILAGLLSYLLKYALPLAKLLLLLLWFKCIVYRTASSSSWCHSAGSCCDHT